MSHPLISTGMHACDCDRPGAGSVDGPADPSAEWARSLWAAGCQQTKGQAHVVTRMWLLVSPHCLCYTLAWPSRVFSFSLKHCLWPVSLGQGPAGRCIRSFSS